MGAQKENELNIQYNNALRERNHKMMKALAGYSHFLFSAVSLMPIYQGELWRGICGDDAERLAMERYQDGMEINWSAWSSASTSREASKMGLSHGVLIKIETLKSARNISQLSVLPREHERIIFPNTKFTVVRPYHTAADGIGEIHLKELAGTFT